MNEKIVKKLEQFPSATPSRWREKAEERRENEGSSDISSDERKNI